MPTIADAGRPVIGGVDTHAGVHVAEMVDQAGRVLRTREFPAAAADHAAAGGLDARPRRPGQVRHGRHRQLRGRAGPPPGVFKHLLEPGEVGRHGSGVSPELLVAHLAPFSGAAHSGTHLPRPQKGLVKTTGNVGWCWRSGMHRRRDANPVPPLLEAPPWGAFAFLGHGFSCQPRQPAKRTPRLANLFFCLRMERCLRHPLCQFTSVPRGGRT